MSGCVNVRDHSELVVNDDWAPAFAKAIELAAASSRCVFVPADASDYTVRKPAPGPGRPSIDLRGLDDFTLVGEGDGSRIRMLGSGFNGSWNLIAIGGDGTGVTVRGLYLDGDADGLEETDPGQHTHTIQVGGMLAGGFAHRVRIVDCTVTRPDGDGVAIAALDGPFGGGDEVSVVDIVGCRFLDCRRSGVSNQRSAELVRIHGCLFQGTGDTDIDFEPSGRQLDTGCRRYSIVGNTFVHTSGAPAVSLSGLSGDNPSRDNIFALNHVVGGRIGMVNGGHTLILGNNIEGGAQSEPVLRIIGRGEGVRVSNNQIVRPAAAGAGKAIAVTGRATTPGIKAVDLANDSLTMLQAHRRATGTGPVTLTTTGTLPAGLASGTDYWLIRVDDERLQLAATRADANAGQPVALTDVGTGKHKVNIFDHARGVDITHNRIQSYTGEDGDHCTVLVTNALECSFSDNEVSSYFTGAVTSAIRFVSTKAIGGPVNDWGISHNRITGGAGPDGGAYENGVTVAAGGVAVRGVRVTNNAFRGCTTHVRWNVGGGGSFADVPMASGNTGEGTDFEGLNKVSAVRISGNSGSPADYVYEAGTTPPFAAADGSTARRRTGGGTATTIFFREAGAWVGK